MMNRLGIKLTFILPALLLASCTAATGTPATPSTPATQTPAATLAPQPSPTGLPTLDPARYYNEEGVFSLALPDGWSAIGPLEVSGDTEDTYNLYVLGADPAFDGGPGSSKIIVADAGLWTAGEFAVAQCGTCPEHPFEDVMLGGLPAQRTLIGGGAVPFTITWIFVENEGKLIGLAIHDPETLAPLEEVLQSIEIQ
jgi:hypothetical protein